MTDSNYKPSVQEEQFLKYHQRLIDELRWANMHFKVWKQVRNHTTDYLRELNQASAFFSSTIKAHLDSAVMHLSKILDKHGKALSIWKFLNFVEQNQDIFSMHAFSQHMIAKYGYEVQDRIEKRFKLHAPITTETVDEDRRRLNSLNRAIRNLERWRHKQFAHIDMKSVLQGVNITKQYPIQLGKFEEIIKTLHDILDRYSIAYHAVGHSMDMSFESGLKTILTSIRFRNEEERKRWGLGEGAS